MKKELEKTLFKAGVLPTYVGYSYFIDAVQLVSTNRNQHLQTCKEIYIPIAQKHNANYMSVERDLRTVRDVFMKNNGKEILQDMGYPIYKERPHVRELIEIFATYFSNQKKPRSL